MAENRRTDGLLPTHIGIIMDGNGRWAQKRGLPRSAGHKQGARVFRNIVRYCREIGIGYLTVYAFSTENWKRPQSEIDAIMDLLRDYLDELERHGDEQQGVLRFIGDMEPLAEDLRLRIAEVQERTAGREGIVVNIALNYGGRAEIVHAASEFARDCTEMCIRDRPCPVPGPLIIVSLALLTLRAAQDVHSASPF